MNLERTLAHRVVESHPVETARVLEQLETEVAAAVLNELEPRLAEQVLSVTVPQRAASMLATLPNDKGAAILGVARAPVAVWLLRRIPENHRTGLLAALEPRHARRLSRSLATREGTAGAMADSDALAFRTDLTVREAVEQHREELIRASHALPVVDDDHRLVGMVRLEDLRTTEGSRPMSSVMKTVFSSVPGHLEQRGIVNHPGWRDATALPVLDADGVFLGMLHYAHLRALERELSDMPAASTITTSRALGEVFGTAVGGFFEALVTFSGGSNDAR